MSVFTLLYLLACLLIVTQGMSTDIVNSEINGSIDIKNRALNVAREVKELDKQLDYLIGTSTDPEEDTTTSIELYEEELFTDGNDTKLTRSKTTLGRVAHNIAIIGKQFINRYGKLILKLIDIGKSNEQDDGLNNLSLTSLLENPEQLKEILADKNSAKLAIKALEISAGPHASMVIKMLIKRVVQNANEYKDGEVGISGDKVYSIFENCSEFKDLYKKDQLFTEGLNLMNAYIDSMMSPEMKHFRTKLIKAIKDSEKRGENKDIVRGSMANSVLSFFKVGQTIINEKLRQLDVNADEHVDNWILKTGNENFNIYQYSLCDGVKTMIVNNTPNKVLKFFAKGYLLTNVLTNTCLIENLATYFLPVGMGMNILQFMCLTTYVMHIAKIENLISNIVIGNELIDIFTVNILSNILLGTVLFILMILIFVFKTEKNKFEKQGLNTNGIHVLGINSMKTNTGKIINAINNKMILDKLSQKYSKVGITMLKFLGGKDIYIIDKITEHLKTIKNSKNNHEPLTLTDILDNTDFFKKLFAMKEFTDDKIKQNLGLDIEQLMTQIVEEMNIDDDVDNDNNNVLKRAPRYLSRASSAVFAIGKRSLSKKMNSFKGIMNK